MRLARLLASCGAAALLISGLGLATPAEAGQSTVTLCPGAGTTGGINQTAGTTTGPLDGSCGTNSAVTLSIDHSTDYAKITFDSGSTGYPPGLALGDLVSASANVQYTGTAAEPYFMLAFTDASHGLGQASATDQLLLIEFQASTLSGTTLALDPAATLFNLYDNTTGVYLAGGQHVTHTLADWLSANPQLATEALQEIRIGMGLTGSDVGAESMTVNSLTVSSVPEPATLALLGAGLLGLAVTRRRRG